MWISYSLAAGQRTNGRPRWNLIGSLAGLAGLLLVALIAGGGLAISYFQQAQAGQSMNPVVGAWSVLAHGAPFEPHVMVFHQDGTLEIDNPEAGDQHTSDSAGYGAWRVDPHQANVIIGRFQEVNADRVTGALTSYLIVTFTIRVQGNTFSSTTAALATYYDAFWHKLDGPYPATLAGIRIQP